MILPKGVSVMKNKPETVYRTKTIQVGSVVVTIHRPVLSDKERVKAEDAVRTALSRYGKAIIGEMKQ